MSLSQEQRNELIEFRKKRQGNNYSVKSRKKARFNESNKDYINISSLIKSEFDK